MAGRHSTSPRPDKRGWGERWRVAKRRASVRAAIVATTGIVLGAAYMLWLYWRICFGVRRNADAAAMPDLDKRELASLGAIAAVVLWMGVYPESFMSTIRRDVGFLMARIERANPPGDAAPTGKAGPKANVPGQPAEHGHAPGTPAEHGQAPAAPAAPAPEPEGHSHAPGEEH